AIRTDARLSIRRPRKPVVGRQDVRRDHRRGAVRRFADRDAASQARLSGAVGRSRAVSERYALDPLDLAYRHGVPQALGFARSLGVDQLPSLPYHGFGFRLAGDLPPTDGVAEI